MATIANKSNPASRIIMLYIIICLLQIFRFDTLIAQYYNYRFHNLSKDDGLSNSGISKIIQDDLGYIWISTEEGLNRYDGFSFKVYKNNPTDPSSIPSDDIIDLALDSHGNIWLGTEKSGLIRFNPKIETFEHFHVTKIDNEPNALPDNAITSLFIDHNDIIWIGTRSHGLVRFDYTSGIFKTFQHNSEQPKSISSNRVFKIIAADDNGLWISTARAGLNLFNKTTEIFSHYRYDSTKNSIPTDRLRNIYLDSKGILWIGSTRGGLTMFDQQKGEFKNFKYNSENRNSLPSNEAYALCEDKDGRIWIGTWARGLSIYDPIKDTFKNYRYNPSDPNSIPGDVIVSIYQDRLGQMWLGSNYSGISYFDSNEQFFIRYQHNAADLNSLSGNNIRSVLEDSYGILWIGTIGNGLNSYNRTEDKFKLYVNDPTDSHSMANNTAWSIYEDNEKTLWIGTTDGLNRYNRESDSFTNFRINTDNTNNLSENNIMNVTGDTQGNLWIATWGAGLNHFDPRTEKWEHIIYDPEFSQDRISDNIKHLLVDKNNNLWAGSSKGLGRYNIETNKWTHFFHDSEDDATLSDSNIIALFESRDGNIWVGTDQGLNIFIEQSESFKRISVENGLSNRIVVGIAEDSQGVIWISTNHGLNAYDLKNNTIKTYFKSDGLQSDEFNQWAYSQTNNRIYFGGINGLNEISPDNIGEDSSLPTIVLTNFLIFNKEVNIDKDSPLDKSISYNQEISIDYTDYIFALEFSALHVRQSKSCKYAYMLEGFDKDWLFTSSDDRKAVYTNVTPGSYVFKVKAANKDGIWNEASTTIRINIIPPWWKTWWANLLLYFFIAILVVSIYLIRVSIINKQKLALEKQVKEKIEEISNKNAQLEDQKKELESLNTSKDRLLSLMSHDVRAPLNSLVGVLSLFENKVITKSELKGIVSKVGSQIHLIDNFLENLSRWAKNQLHGTELDKQEVNLTATINECISLLSLTSDEKNIQVDIDTQAGIVLNADEEKLKFIIRNLVSNAIKFCNSKDRITIKTIVENEHVMIVIEDTGTGIVPEQLEHIFDNHHLSLKGTSDEIGTGLGLSICKEYVDLFGGKIGVESTLGEGCRFWFTIPLNNVK